VFFSSFLLARHLPKFKSVAEASMNALFVLVFYAVAAALFLFGSLDWRNNGTVIIPLEFQKWGICLLIVYGLLAAIWVAYRANKTPAGSDGPEMEKLIALVTKAIKDPSGDKPVR
jgi:hypothetical protein